MGQQQAAFPARQSLSRLWVARFASIRLDRRGDPPLEAVDPAEVLALAKTGSTICWRRR